ncbi:hypothetical protein ABT369_27505 [Dactylosporangium sp. NPDC000244]|uniref:hypothetical protein n=1 Tax=Dactylosporangium sp. NPDC000244 TaxID=3154365 RepID=UPI00332FB693
MINWWQTVDVPLMYLAGWAASAGVLAALLLIIRLLKYGVPASPPPRPSVDYGLLRTVSMVGDLAFARDVRDRLRSNGVRATLATGRDGMVRILVFADELDRARRLISS